MKRLFRSIRKTFRHLTNARTVTIDGVRLVSDQARIPKAVRDMMFREVYEDAERNILLRLLKPGSKVLEIGTGVGFIALLASKRCGASNVLTYEANATLEPLIRENFRLNGIEPTLRLKAMTVDGRPISFFRSENIISSSAYDRKLPGAKVEIESDVFSEVLERYQPDVLIMDVEGTEDELLRIADFGSVKDILVELHPHIIGQAKVDELKKALADKGFRQGENDRKTFHFHRDRA
ncbi:MULTISPECIES: FkbM family methyltransferase [unclassified Ensifer]|uniref:FkbM family methyltransferase n=1 Tax=unclassified Ensifer TaxID=2633371 RepID=UPI0008136903|nr:MULTISPECIES: FkbM family methyltransferase [unclassified Ensifer]OCP04402.1 FkbM family methyltransferase [Ensifer sp. LC11]OCP04682.1 FkbM family methyltransferase [Ensifer sp. LC13]OCP13321.1 FkbM family methyltransferase [Ensifer sp. LC14]OCP30506.1 FkbM family methyltransferase [Ensifer sp. LC499]